jgi:uncharacterized protein (DUF1697 family)
MAVFRNITIKLCGSQPPNLEIKTMTDDELIEEFKRKNLNFEYQEKELDKIVALVREQTQRECLECRPPYFYGYFNDSGIETAYNSALMQWSQTIRSKLKGGD